MKTRNLLSVLLLLVLTTALGQKKESEVTSTPSNPEPIYIYDGIVLPPCLATDSFIDTKRAIIDSMSVEADSVFDCDGELTHLGIVKIYTKDTIHSGAKQILDLTDNWMYRQPACKVMINNKHLEWNEETYKRLIGLKADDIVYVKLKKNILNESDLTLKIKIDE